ncbi:MAG TPA: uL13 family ribosomal protein [Candidatus Paceibacterota bacterium]
MKYIIDAQGKRMGRVASEAANLLMGKNSTKYSRNIAPVVEVSIVNCNKAYISTKKKEDKKYVTFTGFRGGINTEKLGDLIARKGITEAFKRAVYRMLPSNSLRKTMMKNLIITE